MHARRGRAVRPGVLSAGGSLTHENSIPKKPEDRATRKKRGGILLFGRFQVRVAFTFFVGWSVINDPP